MISATLWASDGVVFRTQRGEISVRAKEVTLLSKSLLPLPEKFHGLTNQELRYRQRYVDLIVNPEVRKTFEVRSKFITVSPALPGRPGLYRGGDPGAEHHLRRRQRHGPLSPITTPWTSTCTCALPRSCT